MNTCQRCQRVRWTVTGLDGLPYCANCALEMENAAHKRTRREITTLILVTAAACALFIFASLVLYGSVNW